MILIIDFGSQYTQLLARRIREIKVHCEIIPYYKTQETETLVKTNKVSGIILSGSPHSVYDKNFPTLSNDILHSKIPILGVCYGFHLLNHLFKGEVKPCEKREYGPDIITMSNNNTNGILTPFLKSNKINKYQVWMSHGDYLSKLSEELEVEAFSSNEHIAAFKHKSLPIYGVQFHPEVAHTTLGKDILKHFVLLICAEKQNWKPKNIITRELNKLKEQVGESPDSKVICGLSGGVDSTVAAILCSKFLKTRLHCLFINNGLLRKNEFSEVLDYYKNNLQLNVTGIDASTLFLQALQGVSDPESKRKIIGRIFIEIFEQEAKKINGAEFLIQGTLYTDVIESISHRGTSVTIKSHHNVGGLPEKMQLKLIEPLRELFKDEVRKIGRHLKINSDIINRHPFPGPGLAIRIIGEITQEKLQVLQEADHILINELKSKNLYDKVWQAFVVLLPVQSVGVMGDCRTYENVAAIRIVNASDGMTAEWSKLPYSFLEAVSKKIISEVKGINRVVYDISSKPPATIEWE